MDPIVGQTADADPTVPLDDVTKRVFDQLDATMICLWENGGLDTLQTIAESYARGDTDIETLQYAAERYARGEMFDVFYDEPIEPLEKHGVDLHGQFY